MDKVHSNDDQFIISDLETNYVFHIIDIDILFIEYEIVNQLIIIVMEQDQIMANLSSKYVDQKSHEKTKWFNEQGWGYKDTYFQKHQDGIVRLQGTKYSIAGEKLANFVPWIEENLGLDTKIEPKKA